ncbi:MAG: RluA family pseudouridine synthase [Chitinophagales bacterium]
MKTPFEVIYEDNHIIAINKPAGMLVQGDKTGDIPLSEHVKQYVKEKYNKPGKVYLGVTHRIDRPVSGVLLFARTSKALTRLNKMFQEKTIQKTYWAVVKNRPPKMQDTLMHYLIKDQARNKSKAYPIERKGTKKSETQYKWLCSSDNYHLLEMKPLTGRHHQIRVQLSTIDCPIKGDIKYGFKRTNKDASIHLHARQIEFIHPVSKESMSITAPPPKEVIWTAMTENLVNNRK